MKTKYVALALIVIGLGAGTYFFMSKGSGSAEQQAQAGAGGPPGGAPGGGYPPTEVSVVTIAPQDITFTKDLPGRTSAVRVAEIRPQVNGIVIKRLFEEGSDVTEGQQLYQIDPAPYQAAYESARADMMKAEANVKSVQAKNARYAELVKIGGISKQEYDDVIASLQQSRADVAIAKAALATAKINVDYTKVFSPISGRIGKSSVTEGALVTANQAAALATVQQLDSIFVDVTQSSSEIMELRSRYANSAAPAPQADLVIDGKVYGQPGTLQFSDVSVDPTTGTVQLRVLYPNPDHAILPGLFVHARLPQAKMDNAILVPQQSVARNADGSVTVWVVEAENKANVRPIKVAETVQDKWRVTEGLQAGDRVVVEGVMKIQPGAVVKPVEAGAAAPQQAGQPPAQEAAPAAELPVQQPETEETQPAQ